MKSQLRNFAKQSAMRFKTRATQSCAQTNPESHPGLAAPAVSTHVCFERWLSRRPRRIRLLRQHGLVRTSDPRENARPAQRSVGAARRPEQVRKRAQNDCALERQVPVLEIFDVAGDAVLDVGVVARFAAESAHLGEAGDAWFHERADVIVGQELRELLIVFDQMRTRTDDAHVAPEYVPKLRHLINAEFAKPFSQRA